MLTGLDCNPAYFDTGCDTTKKLQCDTTQNPDQCM